MRFSSHLLTISTFLLVLLLFLASSRGQAVPAQPDQPALLAPSSSPAPARTALVIGNGEYADAPLRNPVNDSRDMAETLKRQGFTVIHLENADRARMRLAVREFEEILAEKKGTGLFYFAGHGIQVEGRKYLLPVGADVAREFAVQDETILAESVLEAMASPRASAARSTIASFRRRQGSTCGPSASRRAATPGRSPSRASTTAAASRARHSTGITLWLSATSASRFRRTPSYLGGRAVRPA